MPTTRCPTLIGRDREMGAFCAALERAQHGHGGAFAVTGEPGIGKSRLLAEFAAVVPDGTPVLLGRAVQDGEPAAFRPVIEALLCGLRGGVTPDPSALGPFAPALGRLLPQYGDADRGIDSSLTVVAEAVLRLLHAMAGDGCALLVLEDLHWADQETLAIVEYLADNLAESSVVLALSAREETATARGLIQRLFTRGAVLPLDLGPLDESSVRAMVAACRGAQPESELLDLVRTRAEGIPLLVEELVAAGARPGTVPATVFELARLRLAALPESARSCLRAAAVLGEYIDSTLLPGVTGLPPTEVAQGLRAAIETQMLELTTDATLRFRHALTREAVLQTLLPLERVDLSRRALRAVETAHPALEDHWTTLAAHLAAAAEDPKRAIELMLDSGRRDLARGALASAEHTLRHARQLAAADQARALEADEILSEVLVQSGRAEPAIEATTGVIEVLNSRRELGPRLADAHLRRARAWTVAGDWAAASAEVERVRAADHKGGHSHHTGADLVGALAALQLGEVDVADRRTAEVLTRAEAGGAPEHLCEALELRGRLLRRDDLDSAKELFERQRHAAQAHDLPLWHVRALHELATIASIDDLDSEPMIAARDAALRVGALGIAVDADLHLTGNGLVREHLNEALESSERCLNLATRLRLPSRWMASVLRAGVLAGLHRQIEAEALLDDVLAQPDSDISAKIEAWHGRAIHWLRVEQRDQARTSLAHAMDHVRLASATTSLPALGQWALVATVDGDDNALDEAAATAGARTARWTRGFLAYAEAVRHGRAGRTELAEASYRDGEQSMLLPIPMPLFRHTSRRLVAEAALRDGWGQPTEWLRSDLRYFEDTGASEVVRACRALLQQANVPVPRRTAGSSVPPAYRERGVTSREMDVLLLIREGLTNREIAGRLVLSPRTVDKHVERLLAKTASTSRRQLGTISLEGFEPYTGGHI